MARKLAPQDLTVALDVAALGFSDTSQLTAQCCGWIGQERAEKAARFGLGMTHPGYNLFVLGETGSGRSSLLFRAMQEEAARRPSAPDLVYLHNFERPECPVALFLRSGQGSVLHAAMEAFAQTIARDIPARLGEEDFRLDRERLQKKHREQIDLAYRALSAFAAERRFVLRRDDGRLLFTLVDENGQTMQEEAILSLTAEQRAALEATEQALHDEIGRYLEQVRPIERELATALSQLGRATAEPLVEQAIDSVRHRLADQVLDQDKFARYLAGVSRDVLDALEVFSADHEDSEAAVLENLLRRYRVNVAVDNRSAGGAPALRDDDLVFRSLFGGIDYQAENGVLVTDFMRIRAGSLARAHGGFLMLHLRDLMRDVAVWEKLQRHLRYGHLQIEEPSAALGSMAATTLEPEAIEVRVKLVLIGSREDYHDLQDADPDFLRNFRVKVDFAESFPARQDTRHAAGLFIAQCCVSLGLPHFTAAAVARLLHAMQREIDDQRRISAAFGQLEALVAEAASYAMQRTATLVDAQDVTLALDERRARHDYPEQLLLDAMADGELMIRVEGSEIGRVNALTQIDLGDYRFGSPVRISARAYAGDEGVLNIDREVEMTGPTHDKGVLILEGWLTATFGQLSPLNLSASLVFEQEYHGVEGDSASCAELYALLSELAGLPLPQGLAVTGALNQHGEVMPIGGVNEKIEGWFRTCKRLGFDGCQGVIVPARNGANLLLDAEVIEAVANGEFAIHVIEHVMEGMELFTGLTAGVADDTGSYPPDSILGRVQQQLENFRKACEDTGHGREHEPHHHHRK